MLVDTFISVDAEPTTCGVAVVTVFTMPVALDCSANHIGCSSVSVTNSIGLVPRSTVLDSVFSLLFVVVNCSDSPMSSITKPDAWSSPSEGVFELFLAEFPSSCSDT